MKRKKLLTLIGVTCLVSALVALLFISACAKPPPPPTPTPTPTPTPAPPPPPTPKPIELKAVDATPLTSEYAHLLLMFADKVEELSEGELIIDILGGPEVIPTHDLATAVKSGVLDIANCYTMAWPGLVPSAESVALSRLTPQEEREIGVYDVWAGLHMKAGIMYLGRSYSAPDRSMALWLRDKIERPQDLGGKKIVSGAPTFNPVLEYLGATGIVLPFADTYPALEQGVADGLAWGFVGVIGYGFLEPLNYLVLPMFMNTNFVFIMNPNSFNSLPEHLQNVILDAVIYMEEAGTKFFDECEHRDMQAMKDMGIEIITFSPEDERFYVDAWYDISWEEYLKKDPVDGPRIKKLLGF